MGSGVIKPNISTLMGRTYDQHRPGQERLRSNAFAIFYMAINIGAGLAYLLIPAIRTAYSYQLAFLVPAVLMTVAFAIFAAGKRHYATEVIVRHESTPEERALKRRVLGRVAGLFLVVMFFWAIFDQTHNTWIFFARTYTDCQVLGFTFDPEQFGFLNPFLIVVLVPVVTLIWNTLDKRGVKVRATQKLMLGFILTALTMGVTAVAGYQAGTAEMRPVTKDGAPVVKNGEPVMERYVPPEERVTIWWQVLAFFLITMAEILISVTGLELAFAVAPKSMQGFLTAVWLASVGLGNLVINVPVTALYAHIPPGDYFLLLTGMMVAVIVVFFFVARWFERQMAAEARAAAEV